MEQKISGIYKIINKIDGKYYVGSSNNIFNRWTRHKSDHRNGTHHNVHLSRSFLKYGIDCFDFLILKEVLPDCLLIEEQKYLDIAKTEKDKCYNETFMAGRTEMTPERRKKISDSKTGVPIGPSPFKGIKKSQEFKDKISIVTRGEKNSFFGGHHTEKTKKILSEYRSGKNNLRYDHNIYCFYNLTNGELLIGTRHDFYTKYKYDRYSVNKLIRGQVKTMKKWILIK